MTAADTSKQLTLPGMSKEELGRAEAVIREGMKQFVRVGHALQQIREKRGYLLKNYKTFDAYVEKEFGFSLRQGERLMLAAQTAETVKKVTGEAPANEAVARVLTSVAKDEGTLKKVARELKLSGKTFATATAEKVADVVTRVTSRTKDNGHAASGPSPVEKPSSPMLQGLSDKCPKCGEVPGSYFVGQNGWECGACHATVRVAALPLELAACKECGKPVTGDYCTNCGAVQ